jgi:hypothetical protein
MDRTVLEGNLKRLRRQLTDSTEAQTDKAHSERAERIAAGIPLSHATNAGCLADIVGSGSLLCPSRLPTWSSDRTEAHLGTGDGVFLFAAPFGRPGTDCGFLFSRELEEAERETGVATAHDSGGLLEHLTLPDPKEAPVDFLRRHELPIPEHRELLREALELLFDDPWHYVTGIGPKRPNPIGLTGGDSREWTHEVRIRESLSLHHHLQAVFVVASRSNDPRIEEFLIHCGSAGVYLDTFDEPRGNVFDTLKRRCIAYLRRSLLH